MVCSAALVWILSDVRVEVEGDETGQSRWSDERRRWIEVLEEDVAGLAGGDDQMSSKVDDLTLGDGTLSTL